jgi:hypothetical protein
VDQPTTGYPVYAQNSLPLAGLHIRQPACPSQAGWPQQQVMPGCGVLPRRTGCCPAAGADIAMFSAICTVDSLLQTLRQSVPPWGLHSSAQCNTGQSTIATRRSCSIRRFAARSKGVHFAHHRISWQCHQLSHILDSTGHSQAHQLVPVSAAYVTTLTTLSVACVQTLIFWHAAKTLQC